MGLAYEQTEKYSEAIEQYQQGVKLSGSPLMLSLLGHAYASSGKRSEAQRILAELDKRKQRYVSPYTIATIYAGLGEKYQAFKWLEKAFDDRDIWLMNLKVDAVFASLRSDRDSRFTPAHRVHAITHILTFDFDECAMVLPATAARHAQRQ